MLCDFRLTDMRTPVLRILTNLLVVSQSDEFKFKTFADCLNGLEINEDVELSANRLVTDGKINSQSIVNLIAESNDEEERFAIDILYRLLVGLFVQPPARTELKLHENVCKTLEALLKCSARSRNIASDEKFMLQIIDQMEKVADSIGGSWADYVRRYGSTKVPTTNFENFPNRSISIFSIRFQTEKYAAKMRLLFNMVISWYSCDCLEDIECVQSMVQTCIRLWPCLAINFDTQSRFMKMLLFLSDDSLPVCKSMASITISMGGNGTQNLLHIILDYCVSETNKAKNPQANLTILELGLRVVSNCCSCIEGRILINKVNIRAKRFLSVTDNFLTLASNPFAGKRVADIEPSASASDAWPEAMVSGDILLVALLGDIDTICGRKQCRKVCIQT